MKNNKEIYPQNDYLVDKSGNEFIFVDKTTMQGKSKDEILYIAKNNNIDSALSIYSKLLNLSPKAEQLYKTLIEENCIIQDKNKFIKLYCKINEISYPTFIRALNELINRSIIKINNDTIYVLDKYNISEQVLTKSILVISLK